MHKITQKLADKAAATLSGQAGNWSETLLDNKSSLQFIPFHDSGVGGFPYYYLDPSSMLFNDKTYNWISASCVYNGASIELSAPFLNTFIEALSSISYQLSEKDEALLASYRDAIATSQLQLVQSWHQVYPAQNNANIDEIIEIITSSWATPAISLNQLLTSNNLQSILTNLPASGQVVLPHLSHYLSSINRSVSLENASSMHTGYLASALNAAQKSTSENGGMKTTAQGVRPRFKVSTSLQQILTNLNDSTANHFEMTLDMQCLGEGRCDAAIDNDKSLNIEIKEVLDIKLNNHDTVINNLNKGASVIAVMQFLGVSIVEFTPEPFDKSQLKNWYWNAPIAQAINQSLPVNSGYKFAPHPQIDFSHQGSFGFLTSVAISKHPGVKLVIKHENYMQIANEFRQASVISLTFIGRQMTVSLASSNPIVENSTDKSVTVHLIQSALSQSDGVNSTAFVLGVKACFPNASVEALDT